MESSLGTPLLLSNLPVWISVAQLREIDNILGYKEDIIMNFPEQRIHDMAIPCMLQMKGHVPLHLLSTEATQSFPFMLSIF